MASEIATQCDEAGLRLALQSGIAVWWWDITTDQTEWLTYDENNQSPPPSLFKGTWSCFLNQVESDDRPLLSKAVQAALDSRRSFEWEFRLVRLNDSCLNHTEVWIMSRGQTTFDAAGRAIKMTGTAIDITTRKQREIALQQLNADLKAKAHERMSQLQQAIDLESGLKRITDKVRDSLDESQILQATVQELGSRLGVRCCNTALYDLELKLSTICYEHNNSMFTNKGQVSSMKDYPEIYQPLLRGEYLQFCNIIPNPIRGRVTMLVCPIFDDQGVLGDLWLINDRDYAFQELELRLVQQVANQCAIAIRQARLYEESRRQVEALEHLSELKDEFLSTVSHELRTPITNMRMSIRMLETILDCQDLTPKQQKVTQYLKILRHECEREIHLINDLLDLQQLEIEERSIVLATIDLATWLPQIVQPFVERARDRQQTLVLDLPPQSLQQRLLLISDQSCLERILSELFNNACKYTPPGETIMVSVQTWGKGVQFTVTNCGVEIAADEIPRIFNKFYRVLSNDRWKQGGTGLGLALVQSLVKLLDGTIQVQSGLQQTSFVVALPNLRDKN
jgi:signal transduction histidine kinase